MQRQRGFLYAVALMALSGVMANRAEAGSITLDVDLNGIVIYTVTSSAPDTSVSASLASVNGALQGAGVSYRFTSLSANSDFSGGSLGFLSVNGAIKIATTGITAGEVLSIDAVQSGFTSPVGPSGTLTSSIGGDYGPTTTGSTSYYGDFNGANSSTLTQGANASSYALATTNAVSPVATGYSLSDHVTLSLGNVANSTTGFTATTSVAAVPEPASLTMLLTGLPVPMVLVGLLRRRKAKA